MAVGPKMAIAAVDLDSLNAKFNQFPTKFFGHTITIALLHSKLELANSLYLPLEAAALSSHW